MKVSSELGRVLAPKDIRQATRMEILMMLGRLGKVDVCCTALFVLILELLDDGH